MNKLNPPALAFFELSSIARGLYLTDQALKKAPVQILVSEPISSGKHILLFQGDVASVEESYRIVDSLSSDTILRKVLIPGIHPRLQEFLQLDFPPEKKFSPPIDDSIAVLESSHLCAAVLGADQALKAADITLCRLKLGQGIGGKAFFVISGLLEDVEASVSVAENTLRSLDSFVRADIIARPIPDSIRFFSGVSL